MKPFHTHPPWHPAQGLAQSTLVGVTPQVKWVVFILRLTIVALKKEPNSHFQPRYNYSKRCKKKKSQPWPLTVNSILFLGSSLPREWRKPPCANLAESHSTLVVALAGVAQGTEHRPANQKAACSIPSQGMCLGWGPGPYWGPCESQLIDVSLLLFLPPFPSL